VRTTYAFSGTWSVRAPADRVQEVLVDLEHYPDWWPQVVAVASLGADDARVLCRSVLPYTLDLDLHAVRRDARLLEVSLAGDLDGFVRWELSDAPVPVEGTVLRIAQEVSVGGWLAAVTPVVGPVLRWNHHQMMAGCLQGLRQRLRDEERRG
jgi:Polyketide cyclase / dehydrase and lipid transport